MKRNLIGVLSLVVLSLMLNATGAYAQRQLRANVPFAFRMGNAQLPAGSYEITKVERTIVIRGEHTGAMALATSADPNSGDPRLVFNHMGNQYFLTQIWGEGDNAMTLPASKLEKEHQIASGKSSGEKVVVALK